MSSRLSQFVRQEIPPPIRPAPPQPAVAEDTDDTGFAVLSGGSGRLIDLAFTYAHSMSRSRKKEIKRKVDKVRVKQMDDEGNVNEENFVDVEVPKKIWFSEEGEPGGAGVGSAESGGAFGGSVEEQMQLAAQEEGDNIEILERDLIRKNPNYHQDVVTVP